ncbi:hypothetical protein b3_0183 [Synechococcus phage B3]|nr:hypothetical protein b3_0183 [Synechococcus phage B3]QGT54797.1 hypothetical protein b23_0182 [Synechococcus phage B23]
MQKLNEQGTEIVLEAEELRGIIQGKIGVRKCPDCQGHGESWFLHYVLVDDVNENEDTKEVSDQFAADFDLKNYPEYSYGECYLYECDTCSGVGYLTVEQR